MIETVFGAQEYGLVNCRLSNEVAIVTFVKVNNDVRVMLCTRSIRTIERLSGNPQYNIAGMNGRQRKLSVASGNIAVVDLALDEVRVVNSSRIIRIDYLDDSIDKYGFEAVANSVKCLVDFVNSIEDLSTIKDAVRTYSLIKLSNYII